MICLQLGDVAVFSLCAQYFLNVRGGGGITTLGAFHTFRKPCVAGVSERRTLPLWDLGREVLPKNAESLRSSDALMRVAVPRRHGPAGLRNLFLLLSELWLVHPALRTLCVYEVGVVSLPSERFTRFGNPAWPGVRTAYFAAFGAWSWVLPKNAESLRDSDALMRVAVPQASRPCRAAQTDTAR